MAQAMNAQAREPSMEEILASIRRIIEDSDTARRFADDLPEDLAIDAAPAEPEPRPGLDDENGDLAGDNVETFSPGIEEPEAELADLSAPDPVEPAGSAMGVNSAVNGFAHRAYPHFSEPDGAKVFARQEETPSEPVRAPQAEPGRETGARDAIISEFAGRQVAAAFEELSDAFSASRKRSYDEIAEEIMRPLLQEWLDNNLPLLVERLVREEIERIARGGVR